MTPSPSHAARGRISHCLWLALTAIFLVGLGLRILALRGVHDEGDEIVYRTLVQQLELGRGYTLQGTPLLDQGWPRAQYGHPLFFHPPGGVLLFWLAHATLGDVAYDVVQLLSYAAFFVGVLWLAALVLPALGGIVALAIGTLAAATPLMTHVTSRHWLDGPLLACATLASVLLLEALRRRRMSLAVAAGVALGYASLIKVTAFLIVPGLVLLVALVERPPLRALLRFTMCFVTVAVLVQLPWEMWQWAVVGSPFPAWAGRPARELVTTNPYVYFLTVVRSPWTYLQLLPRVVWTLVPSLVCLVALGMDARQRRIGWALVAWIAFIIGVHVALGSIGYSKVLRYAILITPAAVLLFGLVVHGLRDRLTDPGLRGARRASVGLLAMLAGVGFVLEVTQGIYTPLVESNLDLVRPLFYEWFP